jgi:para-aminobenzoate synthetase component I
VTGPDATAGVFDTLLVQGGRAVAAPAHIDRLCASVLEVYGVRLEAADLARRLADATEGHHLARARIDVIPDAEVTLTVTDLAARPRAPWHLVVRRVPGGWGRHKWRDRSLLTPPEPADETDLLLVDEHHLLETGRGNVFVVRDGAVSTPPLDGRILPGITRATVVDLLSNLGVGISKCPLTLADLMAADEVFVTSAIGGVRPVVSCATVGEWPPGPVTRAAGDALEVSWGSGAAG